MRLSRENSPFRQCATREFALLAIQVSLREFQEKKKAILPHTWNTMHCSTAQLLNLSTFSVHCLTLHQTLRESMTRSHNHMAPAMT